MKLQKKHDSYPIDKIVAETREQTTALSEKCIVSSKAKYIISFKLKCIQESFKILLRTAISLQTRSAADGNQRMNEKLDWKWELSQR